MSSAHILHTQRARLHAPNTLHTLPTTTHTHTHLPCSYLVQTVIPMLPRLLCEQLCSLNPGEERFAFSLIWTLDADGRVLDEWAGRSVILSRGKLAYPMVQQMIEGAFDPARWGVALHAGAAWDEVRRGWGWGGGAGRGSGGRASRAVMLLPGSSLLAASLCGHAQQHTGTHNNATKRATTQQNEHPRSSPTASRSTGSRSACARAASPTARCASTTRGSTSRWMPRGAPSRRRRTCSRRPTAWSRSSCCWPTRAPRRSSAAPLGTTRCCAATRRRASGR